MSWRDIVTDALERHVPRPVRDEVLAWLAFGRSGDAEPPRAAQTVTRRLELAAVDLVADSAALRSIFTTGWPAWRRWYLREGIQARPALSRCRAALRREMPELVPVWERLVADLAPGDAVAAKFLSQYNPPAFTSGCSHVVVGDGGHPSGPALIRNYDYDPTLFDGLVTRTDYLRRVVGTSDQVWGLLDGVNDAGLAASFTFGGRATEGPGFGIPLVIRYLLETCCTVEEAVAVLRRLPVHLAYNVTVLDASGDHATVYVGPDRAPGVTRSPVTTNHQETVDWPAHSARVGSEKRLSVLEELVLSQADTEVAVRCMLAAPMRADNYDEGFGTLYTAVLRPAQGGVDYRWPGSALALSCDSFTERIHVVQVPERVSGAGWSWAASAGAPSWQPAPSW